MNLAFVVIFLRLFVLSFCEVLCFKLLFPLRISPHRRSVVVGFVPTAGVAIRSFRDEVNREAPDNEIFRHPADYELYQIGTFDDSTGAIEALQPPKLLSRALDLSERGGS